MSENKYLEVLIEKLPANFLYDLILPSKNSSFFKNSINPTKEIDQIFLRLGNFSAVNKSSAPSTTGVELINLDSLLQELVIVCQLRGLNPAYIQYIDGNVFRTESGAQNLQSNVISKVLNFQNAYIATDQRFSSEPYISLIYYSWKSNQETNFVDVTNSILIAEDVVTLDISFNYFDGAFQPFTNMFYGSTHFHGIIEFLVTYKNEPDQQPEVIHKTDI